MVRIIPYFTASTPWNKKIKMLEPQYSATPALHIRDHYFSKNINK